MKLTEDEWLYEIIDPLYLLRHLRKASPRKLRLYACSCLHVLRKQPLKLAIGDDALRLVELAERLADGVAKEAERSKAVRATAKWVNESGSFRYAARSTLDKDGYKAAHFTALVIIGDYGEMEDHRGLREIDRTVE